MASDGDKRYVKFNIILTKLHRERGKTGAYAAAVFNQKCGGYKLKINDADHPPPHCHVRVGGRNARVDLVTFEVLNPPPHRLPPNLVKCLREHQEHMLEAWEEVVILE